MKRFMGYKISLTNDYEMDAVFSDRKNMIVYINMAKLKELTYADFLLCAQGLFVDYTDDTSDFITRTNIASQWRKEVATLGIKTVLLLLTIWVATLIPDLIVSTLIFIPTWITAAVFLLKMKKMDCPVSFPEMKR